MKRFRELLIEARPEIIGGLAAAALTALITWIGNQYDSVDIWAIVLVVGISLGLVYGYLVFKHIKQKRPSKKVTILVADFDGPEPEHYGVTESVFNNLRLALEPYDDVQIKALGRSITEVEGSAVAHSEGEKNKATIVIWGWYRTPGKVVPMSVNFEVLRPPKQLPELGSEVKGQRQMISVAELRDFTLQTRLSEDMAYLSLLTVGMARYAAGDWDGAINCFGDALGQTSERVLALDQNIVYFYRGNAYGRKGDHDQAIKDYSQAIALQPDLAEAYYNRGVAYRLKGDHDQAIEDYSQAIALQPDLAEAYYKRGVAYGDKGDHDQAIEDYSQAIALQPDDAEAYYTRGVAYEDKGEKVKAAVDLSKVLDLSNDPEMRKEVQEKLEEMETSN